jgi:hypothetical protein
MKDVLNINYIPFNVSPMKSAICLWVSPEYNEGNDSDFLEKYAVGIADTPSFKHITFDEKQITVYAERYGSGGGASNGGGVRCANIGDVQVKGIGTNCLVGTKATYWYSHGMQHVIDAVYEAIYANVLNKVLPLGAVKCLGVILTGPTAGIYADNIFGDTFTPCWGALLVREACIRPAHFLRSNGFIPRPENKFLLMGDVARVRTLQKKLCEMFSHDNEYIIYLSKFLAKSANQFAFARIARISHSGTSPSNISIDGRWLDLATSTFLDGGKNYEIGADQRPFFTEYELSLSVVQELIHTYAKFNKKSLNPEPLIKYYQEAMSTYLHIHSYYLFGISPSHWPEIGKLKACDALVEAAHKVIHLNDTLVKDYPRTPVPTDPVIHFIEALFISLSNKALATDKINTYICNAIIADSVFDQFKEVMESAFNSQLPENLNKTGFLTSCAITTLKKAYCSAYYFFGRYRKNLHALLYTEEPMLFKKIIEDADFVSEWVFADSSVDGVCLFKSDSIFVGYHASKNFFFVSLDSESRRVNFESYAECIEWINSLNANFFTIDQYDFLPYLNSLSTTLNI